MAKDYQPLRVLTWAVYALGAAGVGALAVGVLMEIGLLFLGGVGAVVGALVGHNTLDAHARRQSFEPGDRQGHWG
ncbi:hypothetical protein CKO28_04030 [Rhodovibrio sodomensis]|uniref:Glycine zipper family protein n=1 Tax=Rhodovibrio sodomensis TaxID=1088 RepID=A0ABS1DA18_9PROT|nr:hypothetical protein [Rhodovibrio sodomensis]MBK1667210.1 hypothetical protein [Rhodovibrio sodomensis]